MSTCSTQRVRTTLPRWCLFCGSRSGVHGPDDFCKSFYTAPPPKGAYGAGHRCVPLLPDKGMIVMDVVHDEIQLVEILYRDSLS
ncbi:hypothetical protein HKK72_23285 [Actinomadura sp. HBU206391]|nr:hypothetical protein [Actinomadura sp. HBU206391]